MPETSGRTPSPQEWWACVCGWRPTADPVYESGRCEDAYNVHVRTCEEASRG